MRTYLEGKRAAGWCCGNCHTEFFHEGKSLRAWARFAGHSVRRHRRIPRENGKRCLFVDGYVFHQTDAYRWTWTAESGGRS